MLSFNPLKWAHLDSDQGPQPYQGCALTKLSYAPNDLINSIYQIHKRYNTSESVFIKGGKEISPNFSLFLFRLI